MTSINAATTTWNVVVAFSGRLCHLKILAPKGLLVDFINDAGFEAPLEGVKRASHFNKWRVSCPYGLNQVYVGAPNYRPAP